jgi:adenylate cyclase
MDSETPAGYAALAERLLAHRLARPELAGGAGAGDPGAGSLAQSFRRIAAVFALDHAAAAGEPPRSLMSTLVAGLVEATQAGDSRLMLRTAAGAPRLLEHVAAASAPLPGAAGTVPAVVPLARFDGEVVGALELDGAQPPTAEDLALATEVGRHLAELAVAAGLLPWLTSGVRLQPRPVLTGPDDDTPAGTAILARILATALDILGADRGWIMLHDPSADELYTTQSEGLGSRELRVGAHDGVCGACFRTGELVNIAEAYQDPRFNPAIDFQVGYRTRNILCAPIFAGDGQRRGVLQVVNKRRGAFDAVDEGHLRSLAAQMGVTLDYTGLFDQVLRMKSHNESMLRSLTNGVLTIDMRGEVTFVNRAALDILRRSEDELLGMPIMKVFGAMNAWILEAIDEVANGLAEKSLPNNEFYIESLGEWVSANTSLLPLLDSQRRSLGFMLVIESLEREREWRRTMSRYLSNEIIDQLMQESGGTLGGTAQPATTLFSDIRGFTALAEQLGAAGTVSMLNEYFSYMEDVLTNRSGIIDKYVGDAVMAVFGLPHAGDNDAQNAVSAACEMLQVLALLNRRRAEASGAEPIRIGVGLATGTVIAGNIGSPKRMDFTVIGDAVNLASRIESMTKQYGADILICEHTRSRLTSTTRLRRVDVVRVRGQTRPTSLFEVLDHRADDWSAAYDEAIAAYEAGLAAYIDGNWGEAQARFQASLSLRPDDKAARLMIDRCRRYGRAPPADWDGVSG